MIIERLQNEHEISIEGLQEILSSTDEELIEELFGKAREAAKKVYGNRIYIRGLIELTNYCKNDCYYCGIRRGNRKADRYRLTEEQILDCCRQGYKLGFRTFVLQGGEDSYFTDERVCDILQKIKKEYPDCAITLSLGEKPRESYEALFHAGAERYLLRHETADEAHYQMLHPKELSFDNRMRCLKDLKEIGYQTGCGFMVGSPGQTTETLYKDLLFIKELQPQMVGIGPFIPQKDTPFGKENAGSFEMTLRLLAIIRLMHPHVLLPATTALGTIHPQGREMGILAGANVVMPNLSPEDARKKYLLYENKLNTGAEAAEGCKLLSERMRKIGYEVVTDRGDFIA